MISELTVRFRMYLTYIVLALEIMSRNEARLARVATVRTTVTVGRYLPCDVWVVLVNCS